MSETAWLSTAPKFHSPTVGATVSLDPTISVNFIWTPGEAETVNVTSPGFPGQEMCVVLVGNGTSRAITLGTNFALASIINTGGVSGGLTSLKFVSNGIQWIQIGGAGPGSINNGSIVSKMVTYTENATNTVHTGTVPLPAGAWLHDIQVNNSVLWTATAASMKVGDTADDDGYFVGIDLKATDLLVGEILDTTPSTSWGGKEGAYLVAATGRRGPTTSNFGKFYAAGSNITGIITVTTPATTVGRTQMVVVYSVGEVIAAVPSA